MPNLLEEFKYKWIQPNSKTKNKQSGSIKSKHSNVEKFIYEYIIITQFLLYILSMIQKYLINKELLIIFLR